jgi:perosamine synthetase
MKGVDVSSLALLGGDPEVPKELRLFPYPDVEVDDIYAVLRVLKNGILTGNKRKEREIGQFEADYARFTGVRHCVATQSGTSSLHLCMAAVGVEPGDEVILPALSFPASPLSILHQQGIPVFADIDPVTFNIDPAGIEEKISARTRAILVVHLHGLPAAMKEILPIARKHGLAVIEDSSHAHGSTYLGARTGSLGDVAGASIMADKNFVTCGEGGCLTTNSDDYRSKAERLRMFGEVMTDGDTRTYAADTLGWNYRMNPLQAAFARAQLPRLDAQNELRRRNAAILSEGLAQIPGLLPPVVPPDRTGNFHMYRFRIDPARMGLDVPPGRLRLALQQALLAEGVAAREWQNTPLPGQRVFQERTGYGAGCPWTCKASREVAYRIEDYPQTLATIESSLVFAREIRSPAAPEVYHAYVRAFHKIFEQIDQLVAHARALDYQPPWKHRIRLA